MEGYCIIGEIAVYYISKYNTTLLLDKNDVDVVKQLDIVVNVDEQVMSIYDKKSKKKLENIISDENECIIIHENEDAFDFRKENLTKVFPQGNTMIIDGDQVFKGRDYEENKENVSMEIDTSVFLA